MSSNSFEADVASWVHNVGEALDAVFKESAQELVRQLGIEITRLVYQQPPTANYARTGFLRASLVASTQAMPLLTRDNPGAPVTADITGQIMLAINGWEGGGTLYLGYTAAYGAFVHFGANGAPPKPWVTLVAQRWQSIVTEQAAKVRAAFGL